MSGVKAHRVRKAGLYKGGNMGLLLGIGIILLILWALGLFVFSWGAIIYIALVVAVICIVIWLIRAVFGRA